MAEGVWKGELNKENALRLPPVDFVDCFGCRLARHLITLYDRNT